MGETETPSGDPSHTAGYWIFHKTISIYRGVNVNQRTLLNYKIFIFLPDSQSEVPSKFKNLDDDVATVFGK
jgi:hypothetical protein